MSEEKYKLRKMIKIIDRKGQGIRSGSIGQWAKGSVIKGEEEGKRKWEK